MCRKVEILFVQPYGNMHAYEQLSKYMISISSLTFLINMSFISKGIQFMLGTFL